MEKLRFEMGRQHSQWSGGRWSAERVQVGTAARHALIAGSLAQESESGTYILGCSHAKASRIQATALMKSKANLL